MKKGTHDEYGEKLVKKWKGDDSKWRTARRKAARFFPSSYIRKKKKSELKENDRREGRECVGKRNAV